MNIETIHLVGLAAFAVMQVLDVVSTRAFLKRGRTEANPTVRWMLEQFGALWFVPKFTVAGVAGYLLYSVGPQPLSVALVWALVAAWSYALFVNGKAAGWWG